MHLRVTCLLLLISLSDCFSVGPAMPVLDYRLIAADQLVCPEVAALRANSSLQLDMQHVDSHPVLCDIITGMLWPVVSISFK